VSNAWVEGVVRVWHEQRGYAERLVADLSDEEMVAQPVSGVVMNHPAWVLSHLSIYGPVLARMLRGDSFEDPASHEFGRDSEPLDDVAVYGSKATILDRFRENYDEAAAAARRADLAVFERDTPLERWQSRIPTLAHLSVHLLNSHVALHLGQISAWRRAGKRPPV